MAKQKKVLVIGSTGSMSRYLVPLLAERGFLVDGVSLDEAQSTHPNVRCIKANVSAFDDFAKLLEETHYDAVVDFMIYPTEKLTRFLPFAVEHTDHYIYLSSYRVYDNKEIPLRETSPLLLDSCDNLAVRYSDDYSVYKARGEYLLRTLPQKHWTAIRPAITYSFMRYQLVTCEAFLTVYRAFAGKELVLPQEARTVQATMSWGSDVARMIAALLGNDRAFGESYSVCTAEHHSWGEIADYYADLCKLKCVWVPKEEYLRIIQPARYNTIARWQLEYDRLFDRVMENSKILAIAGMKQSELMPLYDGLKLEIGKLNGVFPALKPWQQTANDRMDEFLKGTLK